METPDINALLQKRQSQFIEARTITEQELNKFLESLETLDQPLQQRLGVVPGRRAKDILTSLWEEPFNVERYQQQKANLDQYIAQVMVLRDELNKEALACLQN